MKYNSLCCEIYSAVGQFILYAWLGVLLHNAHVNIDDRMTSLPHLHSTTHAEQIVYYAHVLYILQQMH